MTRTRHHSERGAALLEVLIALALTAMMAAALSGVTGFGLRAVERAEAGSIRMTDHLIGRRALSDALARIGTGPAGEDSFLGTPDRMAWHGVMDAETTPEGATAWQISARDMQLSGCVSLDGAGCEPVTKLRLAPARFAYSGSDGIWQDEWSGAAPPALIRITTGNGGTAAAREVIVAPRITGATR